VAGRAPDALVDAVENARHVEGSRAQKSVETHAVLRRHDFGGVAWRDGGDAVGKLQSRLQKTDAAVKLHAVDGEGVRRQAERAQYALGEFSLEGEIVDGENRRRARHRAFFRTPVDTTGYATVAQIGGRQRRLPVVRVQNIGTIVLQQPLRERTRG